MARTYTFNRRLGAGGYGVVWAATDELNREVAVKFFNDGPRSVRDQIGKRVISLAQVDHPNVVKVYYLDDIVRPDAAAESQPEPALVMQIAPGTNILDWIKTKPKPEHVIDVLKQFLQAINAFHEKGLVHGDIHSGNVHVDANHKVYVFDPMANDLVSVATSIAVEEGLSRDVRAARLMVHEVLGEAGHIVNTAKFGELAILGTANVSIQELAARLDDVVRVQNVEATSAISATGMYGRCRTAQEHKSIVKWQDLGKEFSLSLGANLASWGREVQGLGNSEEDRNERIKLLIDQMANPLEFLIAAAEYGGDPFEQDVKKLVEIIRVDWIKSGESRYVEIPEFLLYYAHCIVGAVLCSGGADRVRCGIGRNPGS